MFELFDPIVDKLARMMARPDKGPGRAPRQHPTDVVLGTVVSVDPYQGTATIEHGGVTIPGVRCTATDLRPGDVATLSVTGPGMSVVGKQVRVSDASGGTLS